eukprot:TRINITY_DN6450_c0_g1_i1.p1 TRINITY_DN6450_c0_g1~~TRINITY_DN6450_c0_g1_i1.p1  ORF type:complete len:573 (-),score=76.18 TRINITY_DN6450_c0_g1_i1:152-1870(-)
MYGTPKDRYDCGMCSGVWGNYSTPVKRMWIPGVYRKATWHLPTVLPVSERRGPLLNFNTLGELLKNSVSQYFQYQYSTEAVCNIDAPSTLLTQTLCQCPNISQGVAACNLAYKELNVKAGTTLVCTGFATHLVSKPATLSFPQNSVSKSGECVLVEVSYVPYVYFYTSEVPLLSSVWYLVHDVDSLLVFNQAGGELIVGIIVSNGIHVALHSSTDSFLVDVMICFIPERLINTTSDPIVNFRDYEIFDIGVHVDSNSVMKVVPLGLVASFSNGSYCATIPNVSSNRSFFLILRSSNWRDSGATYLTKGEVIYMAIVGCCYVIVFFWSLCVVFLNRENILLLMFLYLSVLLIWRGIHLLITAGSWGSIQSSVLSEPPIFFYFGAISVLATQFHFIYISVKSTNMRLLEWVKKVNFVIGVLLLSILLTVILVSELVSDSGTRIKSCFNRVDEGVKRWSAMPILTLVYLCVLGILSVPVGVGILLSGYRINALARQNNYMQMTSKYFAIGLILCSCVLIFATHLIVYGNITSVRANIWLRLTFLWVFEGVPILVLLIFSFFNSGSNSSVNAGKTP